MAVGLGFYIGFVLLWSKSFRADSINEAPEGVIQTECRDRFLWLSVDKAFAGATPKLQAVDKHGFHPVDDNQAVTCGYTISNVNMNSRLTLRASYFSCYTQNQDDESFRFLFNVIVADGEDRETKYRVKKTCKLPLAWSSREIICEETYMEVTVEKHMSCTASESMSMESWNTALSMARLTASSTWQVMFMGDEDTMESMSFTDALDQGYRLDTSPTRVVFRTTYRQPHSQTVLVDGVATEVINATVYYRQKWVVIMLDLSAACTINPVTFDGEQLHWSIPRVMTPLVQDPSSFTSSQIRMGIDGQLLEETAWRSRGFDLEETGPIINISVPFGAQGGYRKSFVLDNTYHEIYTIFMFYEHVFSRVYADGTDDETRHRMMRLLETPMVCQNPFTVDETVLDEHRFTVMLGHFPSDIELVSMKINGVFLTIPEAFQQGYSVMTLSNMNRTHGYVLEVPFDDPLVHRAYLGEGLLLYSLNINYTLHVLPQEEPFYHLASVVAQFHNAFPPDITATCRESGIIFYIGKPTLDHLWEVGVGHELLTPELAKRRGYILTNDAQGLILEVPIFTYGYTYENITLKHFVGVFKITARDSKTLNIQSVATKYCSFQTVELLVCSTDGIMTIVTKTTTTWPKVLTRQITLRDKTCQPQEAHDARIMFSFALNTCGTKSMVGDSYLVYENEIISAKQYIPKDNPIITRDSKFRLTVQCFYPLTSVRSRFAGGMFLSNEPGFGSINMKKNPSANAEGNGVGCGQKYSAHSESPGTVFESTNDITSTEPLPHAGIQPASNFLPIPTWPLFRSGDRHSEHGSLSGGLDTLAKENNKGTNPGIWTDTIHSAYEAPPDQLPAQQHSSNKGRSPASTSLDRAPWKESTPIYHRYKSVQNTSTDSNGKALNREFVSSTGPSILRSIYKEKDISHDVVKSHPHVTLVNNPASDYSTIETHPPSRSNSLNPASTIGSSVSEEKNTINLGHAINKMTGPVQNDSWTSTMKSDHSSESHIEGLSNPSTGQHLNAQTSSKHGSTSVSNVDEILTRDKQSSKRDAQDGSGVPDNESLLGRSRPELLEADGIIQNAPRNVRDFRLASRHFLNAMSSKVRHMLQNFDPRQFAPTPDNASLQYHNYNDENVQETTNLSLTHHAERPKTRAQI
ncbi:uncharacterized protein LOC125298956 isoform X1 [Alosa alosa]|uniref:uncharacterized protein LOC125298956 isoform X1 n=2 Tax=Alosa alosa TaxID=278164 RepID=UPI0020151F0A|nr:uncharacterized protein LOC125298956 isoform X1 [Alosa alosa]XP_048105896.1 uncharacterized protein LOC125298956 isoform X1 [Alosa alosa]